MCAFHPISKTLPKATEKVYARKYMTLGRIVTQWREIAGDKMAGHAQPVKIHVRKPKNKNAKPDATLEIAASSAQCMILQMQKDVILQRINLLFGEAWITDIKFTHISIAAKPLQTTPRKKPLSESESVYLQDLLETVDDPDVKERLERLGRAMLADQQKDQNT